MANGQANYEQLVAKAQAAAEGGEQAQAIFDRLVEQFQGAAFEWALRVLGDPLLAQDATQDAFLTAYRHLDQLREPRAFPTWLRRIVQTHCHRLVRGKQPPMQPLDDEADLFTMPDLSADVEDRELWHALRQAIGDLPEHERVVTELHYLAGLSQREVAEALGLPLTTIKKRLQYAREHLREAMPDEPMCALFPVAPDDLFAELFPNESPDAFGLLGLFDRPDQTMSGYALGIAVRVG